MTDGSDRSFEILAGEHRPMVHAYLRTILGDDALADDLTQETFIVAQRRLAEFRRGESFGAWLRGIARNKVRESRKASARHQVVADSELIAGMEDVYARLDDHSRGDTWEERLSAVRDCIAALPPLMRQAMVATYTLGLGIADAAKRFAASSSNFQRRLNRAEEKVQECVKAKLGLAPVEEK